MVSNTFAVHAAQNRGRLRAGPFCPQDGSWQFNLMSRHPRTSLYILFLTSSFCFCERIDDARRDLELQASWHDHHHHHHQHHHHLQNQHRSETSALRSASTLQLGSAAHMMPGLDGMGQVMKILAICAVVGIAYKMISSTCASRKCDCRRWKIIAQCLLAWGWDEFESFEVLMAVHSVQDVQNEGMFGKKEFKVKASFNWSSVETSGTSDLRWEQTKKLEVPQGASEGVISLWSLGTIKDSKIASYSLDTKKDMLDKSDTFFGKKQKFKLEHKGKTVGTLLVTFWKRGKSDKDIGACPIDGIDDDSPLLVDVSNAIQEMVRKKEMLPLQKGEKLDGEKKIAVLAKTLQGDLREIDADGIKDKGKVYVRTIHCNFAELQGDDMKEEWAKQCEKARKKGLRQPQRKWYFCWYGSKNEALDAEKWHHPDGFFMLASMTQVHRDPQRQDQFYVKYTKETKIYRREQGKSLDSWVEGLDMANQEIRENMKEEKEAEELEEKEKGKAKMMHGQWMQKNGMPTNEEQWTAWFQWMKSGNLEDQTIRNFYQDLMTPQPQAPQRRKLMIPISSCSSFHLRVSSFAAFPSANLSSAQRSTWREMAGRSEHSPLLESGAPEDFDAGKNIAMVSVLLTVPRLIGFGIAFAIYKFGATAKYDSQLKTFGKEDGYGWLYLAVYLFSVVVSFVNLFPMYYKGKVMKGDAGNLRANMFIYTVDDGSNKHVVLEEEGGIGEYNRANRSLGHFVENVAGELVKVSYGIGISLHDQ
eukprot:s1468_g15.t1